jgi:hypothetical protein
MTVDTGQEIPRRVGHVFMLEPTRSCVSDTIKRMNA